jgi:flavin-dependent dehydrogenase
LEKDPFEGNFGDVMVVGGGISGIQAALDMASAGFKVYLVEKGPSWTRPFRPTTVLYEFSLLRWSRSTVIKTSKS